MKNLSQSIHESFNITEAIAGKIKIGGVYVIKSPKISKGQQCIVKIAKFTNDDETSVLIQSAVTMDLNPVQYLSTGVEVKIHELQIIQQLK